MNQPSSPSALQLLFDIALQDYEKQTGTKLVDHDLAKQLEICNSVDSITTFLQNRARAFREFRGEDEKVMRFLRHVVHVLYTLSANATLGEGIGLVCRKARLDLGIFGLILAQQAFTPAKAIFAGFAILLSVWPFLRLMRMFSVASISYLAGHRRSRCEL